MKKINVDGLLSLNLEEIEIVYRRCRGDSVRKAALEMGRVESTFWNVRIPKILQRLGLEKWEEVEEELCESLTSIIPSLQALKGGWPERFREKIEALREPIEPPMESTSPISPPTTSQPTIEPQTRSQTEPLPASTPPLAGPGSQTEDTTTRQASTRNRFPWYFVAIPLLVLCLLCISGVVFARPIIENILATNTTTIQTAQSPLPEMSPTFVSQQLTDTPSIIFTEMSELTPTTTASPSATSPSPTTTQTAMETSTPQPPALFETDFESGFPAGMEYVRENLDIVDGELIAHEYTLLGFGDGTWKNYQVEYEARKHPYCWGLQNNGVAAHAFDQENMIMWSWNYCETGWFEILNGDWITITSGRDIIANPGTIVKIRLVAENGNFTVYVNNNKNSSYFNEKYTQGKVYILVTNSSVIDNIRISQLR